MNCRSLVAQTVRNLPAMQETWVWSLGGEDPLEKGMATHCSILAWEIPWQRNLAGYNLWGCKELVTSERLTLSLSLLSPNRVLLLLFQFGCFYFFFWPDAVARTFNTVLNGSVKIGHPCLALDFRGKAFNFSSSCVVLTVGFSYMAFIMLRYIPSIGLSMRVYVINGCWILSNAFSESFEMIMIQRVKNLPAV